MASGLGNPSDECAYHWEHKRRTEAEGLGVRGDRSLVLWGVQVLARVGHGGLGTKWQLNTGEWLR